MATTKTKPLSAQVLSYIANAKAKGRTIDEIRQRFARHHHGALSGQVSLLHRKGAVERLVEKRGRCHVYVAAPFVEGRETATQGRGTAFEFAVANKKGVVIYRGPEDTAREIFEKAGPETTLVQRKVSAWKIVS